MSVTPSAPRFHTLDDWQMLLARHPKTQLNDSQLKEIKKLLQRRQTNPKPIPKSEQRWHHIQRNAQPQTIPHTVKAKSGTHTKTLVIASSIEKKGKSSKQYTRRKEHYTKQFSSISTKLTEYIQKNHFSDQALKNHEPGTIFRALTLFYSHRQLKQSQYLFDRIFSAGSSLKPENLLNTKGNRISKEFSGTLTLLSSGTLLHLQQRFLQFKHCSKDEFYDYIQELLTPPNSFKKETLKHRTKRKAFAKELVFLHLKRKYGPSTEAIARRWYELVEGHNTNSVVDQENNPFLMLHLVGLYFSKKRLLDYETFQQSIEAKFFQLCDSSPDGTLNHIDITTIQEVLEVPIDECPKFKALLNLCIQTLEQQFSSLRLPITNEKRILRLALFSLYQSNANCYEGCVFNYNGSFYHVHLSNSQKEQYIDKKISIIKLESQGESRGSQKIVNFYEKLTNPNKHIALSTSCASTPFMAYNDFAREVQNRRTLRALAQREKSPPDALPVKCHLISYQQNQPAILADKCDGDGLQLLYGEIGNLNAMQRVDCSKQLISILKFMYKVGFAELDRKPENYLVTFDPRSNNPILHASDIGGGYFLKKNSFRPSDFLAKFIYTPEYSCIEDSQYMVEFRVDLANEFPIIFSSGNELEDLEQLFLDELERSPKQKELYAQFVAQWINIINKRMVYAQAITIAEFLGGDTPFDKRKQNLKCVPHSRSDLHQVNLHINGVDTQVQTRLQHPFINKCIELYGPDNTLELIKFFNRCLEPNLSIRLNAAEMAERFEEIEKGLRTYLENNDKANKLTASSS